VLTYKFENSVSFDDLKLLQNELKQFLSKDGPEDFTTQLDNISHAEYVYDDKLIGVLLGRYNASPYEFAWNLDYEFVSTIDLLVIHKDYQNLGIGTKLIQDFQKETDLPIFVGTCADYGYYIYEKMGFMLLGEKEDYYKTYYSKKVKLKF
jgi:ribosomal protein S18 acetylase RimI-like enzyme